MGLFNNKNKEEPLDLERKVISAHHLLNQIINAPEEQLFKLVEEYKKLVPQTDIKELVFSKVVSYFLEKPFETKKHLEEYLSIFYEKYKGALQKITNLEDFEKEIKQGMEKAYLQILHSIHNYVSAEKENLNLEKLPKIDQDWQAVRKRLSLITEKNPDFLIKDEKGDNIETSLYKNLINKIISHLIYQQQNLDDLERCSDNYNDFYFSQKSLAISYFDQADLNDKERNEKIDFFMKIEDKLKELRGKPELIFFIEKKQDYLYSFVEEIHQQCLNNQTSQNYKDYKKLFETAFKEYALFSLKYRTILEESKQSINKTYQEFISQIE